MDSQKIAALNALLEQFMAASTAAPVSTAAAPSAEYAAALADPIVVDVRKNGRPVNAGGYFIRKDRADWSQYRAAQAPAPSADDRAAALLALVQQLVGAAAAPSVERVATKPASSQTLAADGARVAAAYPDAVAAIRALAELYVGREHTYRDVLVALGIAEPRKS